MPEPSSLELVVAHLEHALGAQTHERDILRTGEPRPFARTRHDLSVGVALDERWPDEVVAALRPDASSAVVTLSHDIKIDDPALIEAVKSPAPYIAALGSRRSHAARRERLAAAGVSETDIDRIEGPAGLSIGAIGPAEIALSIAAGMVQAFHAHG